MSDDERLDRLIAAEQDERRRIALFLHDGPVQNLAGIALMLDATLHSIQTGKLEDATNVLSTALDRQRATIRELRDLSFALEPVVLRDQGSAPRCGRSQSRSGRRTSCASTSRSTTPSESARRLRSRSYTIVRELLDQAVRRGPPTRVEVKMTMTDEGGIETCVSDDAEPERRRRSFEAIEERVKQLHGTIDVDVAGDRTTVTVVLPAYATRR